VRRDLAQSVVSLERFADKSEPQSLLFSPSSGVLASWRPTSGTDLRLEKAHHSRSLDEAMCAPVRAENNAHFRGAMLERERPLSLLA
jgi:hypothetical protein